MEARKEIWTIPNMLSMLRLLLIPVFALLYLNDQTIAAVIVLAISSLTDMIDGKVARATGQITELGVLLDPVADKFTQGVVVICLAIRHPMLWWLLGIEVIKEGFMLVAGAVTWRKKHLKLDHAEWYGKVFSALMDVMLLAFVLFPMNETLRFWLVLFCGAMMVVTLILYARYYIRLWKANPSEGVRSKTGTDAVFETKDVSKQ